MASSYTVLPDAPAGITVTPTAEIKMSQRPFAFTGTPTKAAIDEIKRAISIVEWRIICHHIAFSLARTAGAAGLVYVINYAIGDIGATAARNDVIAQDEAIARSNTQVIIDGMIANRTFAIQPIIDAFQRAYVINNVTRYACSLHVMPSDDYRQSLLFDGSDVGNQQLSHMQSDALCSYTSPPIFYIPAYSDQMYISLFSPSFTLVDYDSPSSYHNTSYLYLTHEGDCSGMDCNDFSMTEYCSGLIYTFCKLPRPSFPSMPSLPRLSVAGSTIAGLTLSLLGIAVEAIHIVANDLMRRCSWPNLYGSLLPTCFNTEEVERIAKKYNIRIEADARNTLDNFKKIITPLTIIESTPTLKDAPFELHRDILCWAGFFPLKKEVEQKNQADVNRVQAVQAELREARDNEVKSGARLDRRHASNPRSFIM